MRNSGWKDTKSEGLVPINDKCESTIPGLYAAGDALGSYMAGAIYTQIGSSLAGSAVQGAVAGKAAPEHCQGVEMPTLSKAKVKLKASLMRKESRCSHYRLDYPEMDSKNWNAWINIYKGSDGSMKFEKQPFDTWPS